MTRLPCALGIALLLWAFSACEGRQITVFSEPDSTSTGGMGVSLGTGGGSPANAGTGAMNAPDVEVPDADEEAGESSETGDGCADDISCSSNADCNDNSYCSKATCDAEVGVCKQWLLFCDQNPAPVCGCDHVTYWNDCLRASYRVAASTAGECRLGQARPCYVDADCGDGNASCSHLLAPLTSCGPAGVGTCWVTPDDCAAVTGDTRHYVTCLPPGVEPPPGPAPCLSTCEAVQSGTVAFVWPRNLACR